MVVFWDLGASELPYPLESSAAANTGLYYVQGVHAAGDDVWFCRSAGDAFRSVARLNAATIDIHGNSDYPWPEFGEGLTWSSHTDHLWGVRELQPGDRACFCVFRSDVPP